MVSSFDSGRALIRCLPVSRMSAGYLKSFCLAGAVVIGGAGAALGQDQAVTVFDRPGVAHPGPGDNPDQELNAIQLSGISTLGGQSMFNFVDTRNNRSFWVPLKGSANGFSVVSYDPATDTVVVDRAGRSRAVQLRQAQIVSMPTPTGTQPAAPARAASAPAPAVVRTPDGGEIANPKTPQEIAQAETEARMMVSDLLEISMQERARQKALREAQIRQQQQGGTPNGR